MSSSIQVTEIPAWVWPLHYSDVDSDDQYSESYHEVCETFKKNPKLYIDSERLEFIKLALKNSYTPGQLVVMKPIIDGMDSEETKLFLRNRIEQGFVSEKEFEKYKLMALYTVIYVPINL